MKIGLNLGCGTRLFKSTDDIKWWNQDINERLGVDLVGDWRDLHKLPNSIKPFDLIVAHQTFEHQGCGEQPIKACYDVLRSGGSLIVSVPDLRKLAHLWIDCEIDTQIYLTNIYGPYDGTEESRHRWGFDMLYLHDQLRREASWSHVVPFDWRQIPGADIARDDRWILCLEAIK